MRKKSPLTGSSILLCIIIGLSYSAIMAFAPPLTVVQNTLLDTEGRVVRLEGFAVYDATNWKDKSIVANWKNNWKVNVIRLTLHPWLWYYRTASGAHPSPDEQKILRSESEREAYLKHVDDMLHWCKEYGIYVIFDGYHESGNTGSVAQHWDYVKNVWPILAKRYKDADHIIWEIYNEPYNITWADWAPKAGELVDIIRSYTPVVTACIVPGVDWATELDFDKATIDREQIVYSFHIYPHVYNHVWEKSDYKETYDRKFGYISKNKTAPIYIGEWHAIDDNEIKRFGPLITSYAGEICASQTQWGYFPGWGRNLVDNSNGQPEKKSAQGKWYCNYLNSISPIKQERPVVFSNQQSRLIINAETIACFYTGPDIRLRIFDMQGRLIFSRFEATGNSENNELHLPVKNNRNGTYLVELKTAKQTAAQTLTISKY